MKASVIIPARNAQATLPRTLRSLEAAAAGLDVQTVVVDDAEGRGISWARNRGLDRATGDVVFFADADDVVRPGFFSTMLSVLASTGADFMLSSFDVCPLKRDYNLSGAAVREVMLPAFFGYSFDDVRRWNGGGELGERREMGGVWRCAFRRDFIERHSIRFDEGLRLFEDAPFIAECAAHAERTASVPEVLYEYVPAPGGLMNSSVGTDRYWEYKFAALEARRRIDARAGGGLMRHFEASAAFSAAEMLKARRRELRRYLADPFVASAVRRFPMSPRHPLAAAAMVALRLLAQGRRFW